MDKPQRWLPGVSRQVVWYNKAISPLLQVGGQGIILEFLVGGLTFCLHRDSPCAAGKALDQQAYWYIGTV